MSAKSSSKSKSSSKIEAVFFGALVAFAAAGTLGLFVVAVVVGVILGFFETTDSDNKTVFCRMKKKCWKTFILKKKNVRITI